MYSHKMPKDEFVQATEIIKNLSDNCLMLATAIKVTEPDFDVGWIEVLIESDKAQDTEPEVLEMIRQITKHLFESTLPEDDAIDNWVRIVHIHVMPNLPKGMGLFTPFSLN